MRLYITLEPGTAEKMAHALGVEVAKEPGSADGALLFFKNSAGGVSDPAQVITNPATTVVIAGIPNDESIAFAEEAAKVGVPEQNIIFTAVRGVRISDIQPLIEAIIPSVSAEKINEVPHKAQQPDIPSPASVPGRTLTASSPQIGGSVRDEKRIVKIPRVIGVVGYKGGVGRTTFAASLVAHYASVSEKAVLLDASLPHNGIYHISAAEAGDVVEGSATRSEELKAGYRRIVVDTAPSFEDMGLFEKIVVVVDADTVQSLDPTVDVVKREGVTPCVVVYNRKRAEVPKEIVEASFSGVKVLTVEDDFAGCRAALAAGVPASMRSEAIARVIGEIAAIIDTSLGGEVVYD